MKNLKLTVNEKEYKSLASLAKAHGLSKQLVWYRYQKGIRGNELVRPVSDIPTGKAIVVNGVAHPSISELARAHNLNIRTVRARHKRGLRGEELIVRPNDHYNK